MSKNIPGWLKGIMPVVQVCNPLCPELPYIVHDFRYIARYATEHLIERGHRQIALVTFDNYTDSIGGMPLFEHNEGYETAMREAGLNPRTLTHESHAFKHSADDAYKIAEQILQLSPRPTAVVSSSNSAAFGLIKRWQEVGVRVPEDISIIGCASDLDIPECLSPELNSFKTEFENMGRRAFQLCLKQKKQLKPEHFRMKLQLLEGKTVRNL